jgi:hypothetical protein
MMQILPTQDGQLSVVATQSKAPAVKFQSIWVLIGFTFWFGFYLGAILMHAVTK